jgi:hypothetical protein
LCISYVIPKIETREGEKLSKKGNFAGEATGAPRVAD